MTYDFTSFFLGGGEGGAHLGTHYTLKSLGYEELDFAIEKKTGGG